MVVKISKYYCSKCERYHTRGKIYQEHLKFIKNKVENTKEKEITKEEIEEIGKFAEDLEQLEEISLDELDIEVDFEDLRPIAQRQVVRLLEKAHKTDNPKLYKREIKRLLIYEDLI